MSREKVVPDVSVLQIMRPIQFVFRFYGLFLVDTELCPYKTLYSVLGLLGTMTLCSMILLGLRLSDEVPTANFIAYRLAILSFAVQMFSTHVVLLLRRKQLCTLFQTLKDIQQMTIRNSIKLYAHTKRTVVISICLLPAVHLVTLWALYTGRPITESQLDTYGSFISNNYPLMVTIVYHTTLYHTMVILYVSVCTILVNLTRQVVKLSNTKDANLAVLWHHDLVCDTIRAANDVFKELLFLGSATQLTIILTDLYVMKLYLRQANVSMLMTVSTITQLSYFILMNRSAGCVNSRVIRYRLHFFFYKDVITKDYLISLLHIYVHSLRHR